MLHLETVKRETLVLLKSLMEDEYLNRFYLVGGTALALYLGHRLSIDLDLFTPDAIDTQELSDYLSGAYGFKARHTMKNTMKGEINGVRIDIIKYKYPTIGEVTEQEGIRMYSIPDIAAMKLTAIADSGTRLKDFVDIAFLSTRLSLYGMLDAYEKKYEHDKMRPLRGLSYYGDIVFQEPIRLLKGTYKWDKIERRLREMIREPERVFATTPV
jgi:predicted nucleotidyltransferase component of viral defense system